MHHRACLERSQTEAGWPCCVIRHGGFHKLRQPVGLLVARVVIVNLHDEQWRG